jgi:hypothetical protein
VEAVNLMIAGIILFVQYMACIIAYMYTLYLFCLFVNRFYKDKKNGKDH